MNADNRNPDFVPPKVPSFSTRATTPKVVEEPVSATPVEPVFTVLDNEDSGITLEPETTVKTETSTEASSESKTDEKKEEELDDSHDGNKYGNAWEIIQHTGVAFTATLAILSAVVAGAAAYFFAPQPAWIAIAALGFFMGLVAAVDLKTHLIKDQHTIIAAIVTVPLGIFVASQLGWWNLLGGGVTAIAIFASFFALILFANFGSGGDIKFSPIPSFVLGVVNPLLGALWMFLALVFSFILLVSLKAKYVPFGAGMAIALPVAIVATKFAFDAVGLVYL